ncbi:MAG: cytochrome d ubiquinol oxidase subunit II [Gammaproteobacteria bacterium]|nr:cytochrome d ubiquinol oxidase subunit II [Gammaproteobacteria bacterium]
MSTLPLIWGMIIGFIIIMYVILDGFTLGSGILLPLLSEKQRDLAISMILPTWDGNQTWLVLGGASLYGAFPLAFSTILPAFYLPLMLMVIFLLFRGVSFEFRLKATKAKAWWDRLFSLASLAVTLIQGTIVGNMVLGFDRPHHYFNPFTIFTALGLVVAYSLLGSTRLILKTEGKMQEKMYQLAYRIVILIFAAILVVCLWTPFVHPKLHRLWFTPHHWDYLIFLPLITAILALLLCVALYKKREVALYWLAVFLILCPYIGFIVNLYPYAIPYKVTLWQAAAPRSTLIFMLVGAIIMLPILLCYTGYAYHIFRGKVKDVLDY